MILITLGTQDKSFVRLLEAVETEIKKGHIKEDVIVQAGHTKYISDNMKIYDFLPIDKLEELIEEADIIITHGGVSSIISALKHNKKIIAAPRLKKYKEHTNDHQLQIIEEFAQDNYLLALTDFNKLDLLLKEVKKFKPKKYESHHEEMINLVDNTIISFKDKNRQIKIVIRIMIVFLLLILFILLLIKAII